MLRPGGCRVRAGRPACRPVSAHLCDLADDHASPRAYRFGRHIVFTATLVSVLVAATSGLPASGGGPGGRSPPSIAFLVRGWVVPPWGALGRMALCGLISGVGILLDPGLSRGAGEHGIAVRVRHDRLVGAVGLRLLARRPGPTTVLGVARPWPLACTCCITRRGRSASGVEVSPPAHEAGRHRWRAAFLHSPDPVEYPGPLAGDGASHVAGARSRDPVRTSSPPREGRPGCGATPVERRVGDLEIVTTNQIVAWLDTRLREDRDLRRAVARYRRRRSASARAPARGMGCAALAHAV